MLIKKYELLLEFPGEGEDDPVIGNINGNLIRKSMQTLLKVIDAFSLISQDEQIEDEIYHYTEYMISLIRIQLKEEIHSFRMEQDIIGLLLKSDTKVKYFNCPFQTIFIDADIIIDNNLGIYGMFITDVPTQKCLLFGGMIKVKTKKSNDNFVHLPYFNKITDDGIIDYYNEQVKKIFPANFQDKIANFVCCFLYFLNYPDIEVITYKDKEVSQRKNNQSSTIKYKDNFIRLTGKTKIYLENLKRICGGKIDWTHSFWVRGHFMRLKAQRYKENIGKAIWKKPFIKGKGILIKKEYKFNKLISVN